MRTAPDFSSVAGVVTTYGLSQGVVGLSTWETADGAQPTPAETVTVGGDVYEWDGAGANINVAVGASYSESLNNLVTAINGSGAENVVAAPDAAHPATTLIELRSASAVGGPVDVGTLPVLAGSVDPWKLWADGNPGDAKFARGSVTFNADNVAAAFDIDLTFPPSKVTWKVFDATGEEVVTDMTVLEGAGNFVTVNPIAGITPPVATNFLVFEARE